MTLDAFAAWCQRAHTRTHARPAGTDGPDDLGCNAGCTDVCDWVRNPEQALPIARERARYVHVKFGHLGTEDACQSPHDVLCKAVWP